MIASRAFERPHDHARYSYNAPNYRNGVVANYLSVRPKARMEEHANDENEKTYCREEGIP